MTSDLTEAFASLEQRNPSPMASDRISVRDHVVTVDIGAFQQERGAPQRLRINVVVEVPTAAPGDDVDSILSYDALTDAIDAALCDERLNLLETLAERIAQRILVQPAARRCFVRIEKLDRGPGDLGVEIVRDGSEIAADDGTATQKNDPLVVYLSPEAQNAPNRKGWFDELAALGQPVILCAGVCFSDQRYADEAQRRIDLLSLDQAAWRLGRDETRGLVVATRTELDWALGRGQLCIWAPSKMVLDAVPTVDSSACSADVLAQWLALQMGASGMICVGDTQVTDAVAVIRRSASEKRLMPKENT